MFLPLTVAVLTAIQDGTCGKVCPDVSTDVPNGGWQQGGMSILDTDVCSIERRDGSGLSKEEFLQKYWNKQPVIVEGWRTNLESNFAAMCSKEVLLEYYRNMSIILSSANKNSYEKKTTTLEDYVENLMSTPPVVQLGNTTWYHFGNNDHKAWPDLFDCYQIPDHYMEDPSFYAYSFGMGASGSGVPYHTHGGVFNEVFYGRKRWWLAPPGPEPSFHPDESAMQWLYTYYPTEKHNNLITECVIGPGEFIYVPSMWHHSTLNIGQTVFMATFL